jgi:hypothetical protein
MALRFKLQLVVGAYDDQQVSVDELVVFDRGSERLEQLGLTLAEAKALLLAPVAASVDNHGATGYMGSALKLDTFEQRISEFQAKGWPAYSAYLEQYWADNARG